MKLKQHLCSVFLKVPPQFIPLQMQQDGTYTYLASFVSQTDADLVTTHCPLGSLRDNTFITIMCPMPTAPLLNRGPTMLPFIPTFYPLQQ